MDESIFSVYREFDKIIKANYSEKELSFMDEVAEKEFIGLDWEIANNLNWDSTLLYDQEEDWDFPDPPEFS